MNGEIAIIAVLWVLGANAALAAAQAYERLSIFTRLIILVCWPVMSVVDLGVAVFRALTGERS